MCDDRKMLAQLDVVVNEMAFHGQVYDTFEICASIPIKNKPVNKRCSLTGLFFNYPKM